MISSFLPLSACTTLTSVSLIERHPSQVKSMMLTDASSML